MALVLAALGTLVAALWLGDDFWEDGRQPPRQVEGTVRLMSRPLQPVATGRFRLTTDAGQVHDFELRSSYLTRLAQLQSERGAPLSAVVTFSPLLRNVYSVKAGEVLIEQDRYEPGQPFQSWQRLPIYILIVAFTAGLSGLLYALLALTDWLWPLQLLQGVLVARIERAETRLEGFSIIVRPWNKRRPGKQAQFELGQANFLATDGVDFIEVAYTRFFRYVRHLRPLSSEELPPQAKAAQAGLVGAGLRLSYIPGWRTRLFLYADGVFALALFGLAFVILLGYIPEWLSVQRLEPPQWVVMPLLAVLAATLGVYLLLRFRRKLEDLKAPKRITTGPVLSKWRVTGTSNDNRRLIVVADGGIAAGETSIRKFDLSPALFDQLQVGDIVEIEHTPRLRFICRLEVKGHQELTRSYQV